MLDMGTEGEDCATNEEAPIDPGPAQHDASFLLQMLKQSLTGLIGVGAVGHVAESDDRQVGRRTGVEPWQLGQAGVEIAGKPQLFLLSRAEGGNTGQLQRKP